MIGTVSDVAPVMGENRAIAKLGLERMRTRPRPGIAALLERARVAPALVDLETVGFVLAPRLNAAGRVGEALDAARLLLAETAEEAAELAATLETANATRRDLMRTAIAEARAAFGMPDPGAGARPGGAVRRAAAGRAAASLVAGGPEAAGAARPSGRGRSGSSGSSPGASPTRRAGPTIVGTRIGDVDPGLVPERRAGQPRRGARPRARTCSSGSAGMRRRPASSCRRSAGTRSRRGSSRPRRERHADRRPPAARRRPGPARRRMSTTRCTATSHGSRRAAPGTPSRWWPSSGSPCSASATANGGHTQLVLRRERDVLDGIAFGRPDLASVRRGRGSSGRRRAAREPGVRRPRDAPAGDPRRRRRPDPTRAPREVLARAAGRVGGDAGRTRGAACRPRAGCA